MTYQHARAVCKLYDRRTEGWDEAEWADAQFDGGEWSGPVWGREFETEMGRTIQDVADCYHTTYDTVYDEYMEYINIIRVISKNAF